MLLFHFLATNCFFCYLFFPGTDKPTVWKIKNETRKNNNKTKQNKGESLGEPPLKQEYMHG